MTKYATSHVGRKPLTNAMHGERFARSLGTPLNMMVSLNFDCLGIGDETAEDVFIAIKSRVKRAWKHKRTTVANMPEFMWVYVHENPQGKRHVHWIVHVPPWYEAEFKRNVENRTKKVTGARTLGKALHFKRVTDHSKVMKYIGKGVHPMLGPYFFIRYVRDQGTVSGRRVMTSRSIGATARKEAGWSRKRRYQAAA